MGILPKERTKYAKRIFCGKKNNFVQRIRIIINHDLPTRLTITMTNLRDFSRLKTQLPDAS